MDELPLDTTPSPSAAPAALGAFGGAHLTRSGIASGLAPTAAGAWRHELVVLQGLQPGRRIRLPDRPLVIGRRTAADLVLPDPQVSGLHCRLRCEPGRPALKVTDLNSTNGCFIDGQRIQDHAYLAPSSTLGVGQHLFRYDCLPSDGASPPAKTGVATEGELTVATQLPAPWSDGPVRTAGCYRPARVPCGAGVAVLRLPDDRVAFALIDVTGPAGQGARQAAQVLRSLRGIADVPSAEALLQRLSHRDQVEESAGCEVNAWVALYDPATRALQHASAGHHPVLMRVPEGEMWRLDAGPTGDLLTVPAGSRLYLFSKACFQTVDCRGRPLTLDDFEAALACLPAAQALAPEQVLDHLLGPRDPATWDDDVLLFQADLV